MGFFSKRNSLNEGSPAVESADGHVDFLSAIEAHVRWKIRLQSYIDGESKEQLDEAVVGCDDRCVLGMWIHGPGKDKYGDKPLFEELRETHAQFHRCAGEVVGCVHAGELEKAQNILMRGEYPKYSHQVKAVLARLCRTIDDW